MNKVLEISSRLVAEIRPASGRQRRFLNNTRVNTVSENENWKSE